MFDIGWTEMAVIALVVIIFIGPKELPGVLRTLGQWVSKARAMARPSPPAPPVISTVRVFITVWSPAYSPIRPAIYSPNLSKAIRSCSMESRIRTVAAWSSSESKSTVTQNGVPISSWRR